MAAYSTLAVAANLYSADLIKILKQAGVDSNNITAVKTDCGAGMLKILPGDKNYRQFFVAYEGDDESQQKDDNESWL